VQFVSGVISGRAPLFERFVLGNSQTLRGWSKFDVAPLGASRMAHNSLEYRYKIFRVVYDAGAAWDRGQHADPKHSLGVGLRRHEFSLLVAFPVRAGRAEPMFIAGMNF
jgi:outer membrane protein assembly factor BamA